MNGKKSRVTAPPTGSASKRDVPEATDGALPYTSEQLRKMDRAFASAIRKAIASGSERDRGRR
jgi:hypothetical protein